MPSRKLNIAIVTHRFVMGDGQGRVNLEVAHEALRRGHSLELLATEIDDSLQQHPAVVWHRVQVERWPSELLRNQVFASRTSAILKERQKQLDLVVVNGAITRGRSDLNAVHMVHSAWLKSPYHSSKGKFSIGSMYQRLYTYVNSQWERRSFRNSKIMIAVSQLLGDQISEVGIPQNQIRVIPNGVDVSEFYPGTGDRGSLGVPEASLTCLFAGDIKRSLKNLDSVLQALTNFEDVHLLVAGDTEGSPYPAMARKLGVDGRVHFLGYRRDLPLLMRAADIFVFPSRYESFSLVLLEAMATGIPVITARTVGAASLVGDSAGIVIEDPEDLEALVAGLSRLVNDASLRSSMGNAGKAIAQNCTFKRMAESYVNLFEETS